MKSSNTPPNPDNPCSLAIIEGALCRVNRKGRATGKHQPVGTAVVEFLAAETGPIIVREWGHGFLPGLANLYCLDEKLRLLWMAELPDEADFFETLGPITDGQLACTTQSGRACRLDLSNGRLVASPVVAVAAG